MQLYNFGEPMERVAIDVLGPLPETDQGNNYILIAMDYFSKWPEAYALPNQEAVTVAAVFVSQFLSRFGIPGELHSDQGRNFESSVFQEVCTLLAIHQTRTTAQHPQSDGIVERYNRTIEAQLATFVQDHQRDWDDIYLYYSCLTVQQCMKPQSLFRQCSCLDGNCVYPWTC